jgi:hypothetical protein
LADSSKVPAIAGLAVGAGMITLFSIFFVPAITNPDVQTLVSYEPTQCSTAPWINDWNKLHPEQNFHTLAQDEQYQVIKDYYKEVGIAVFDVMYRWSNSPECLACGCSAGYIIDFQVNDSDVDKLRGNILRGTVQIDGM